MNQLVTCNYAVLRFRPYPETGEFVNVGVILLAHTLPWFGHRLETKRHRRVTDFFPELDVARYRQARDGFALELVRIGMLIGDAQRRLKPAERLGILNELIRPRESVFRFSEAGTVLSSHPETTLRELFELHVHRQFARDTGYQETIMARRLGELLQTRELLTHYRRNARVGNDRFHTRLAFVSRELNPEGIPKRAIKPLDLDRPDPTRIYDHGDAWIQRVKRLRQMNCAPPGLLFPVRLPRADNACRTAAEEIQGELIRLGGCVVPELDDARVLEFASQG